MIELSKYKRAVQAMTDDALIILKRFVEQEHDIEAEVYADTGTEESLNKRNRALQEINIIEEEQRRREDEGH